MAAAGRFGDLAPRVASGIVIALVGIGAVWAGGLVFRLMVCALVGAMVWELSRMADPDAPSGKAPAAGLSAAVALLVFTLQLAGGWLLGAVALAVVLLAVRWPAPRAASAAYLALILFAGVGLILMRQAFGWDWVLWLVLVVAGSDIAGYFAGRMIGGPRFWPRVSPKKTWSGTMAGWLLAAIIGWAMAGMLGAGTAGLMVLSVLIAMAGQAGDIAESALKRRVGVKDSSNLIPGHGGVMDRFDALIAAALTFLILAEAGLVGAVLRDCAGGGC